MHRTLIALIFGTLAFAAEPAAPPADDTATLQLKAERARREFYQLQAQSMQLSQQLQAKAQEANGAVQALADRCKAKDGNWNGEDLSCAPKPPADKPAEKR